MQQNIENQGRGTMAGGKTLMYNKPELALIILDLVSFKQICCGPVSVGRGFHAVG
jgi:hypothetical protein